MIKNVNYFLAKIALKCNLKFCSKNRLYFHPSHFIHLKNTQDSSIFNQLFTEWICFIMYSIKYGINNCRTLIVEAYVRWVALRYKRKCKQWRYFLWGCGCSCSINTLEVPFSMMNTDKMIYNYMQLEAFMCCTAVNARVDLNNWKSIVIFWV